LSQCSGRQLKFFKFGSLELLIRKNVDFQICKPDKFSLLTIRSIKTTEFLVSTWSLSRTNNFPYFPFSFCVLFAEKDLKLKTLNRSLKLKELSV